MAVPTFPVVALRIPDKEPILRLVVVRFVPVALVKVMLVEETVVNVGVEVTATVIDPIALVTTAFEP